jgi:dipeptidyl aminopeptidase/acylaminoacyl peptidase
MTLEKSLCIALLSVGFLLGLRASPAARIETAAERSSARHFGQVAMSPDGSSVAWVELLQDPDGMESRHSIIRCAALNSQQLTPQHVAARPASPAAESGLAWAPDGKRLAFLSDADEPGQLQLYTSDCPGASPQKLTSLHGLLADPQWSPDGKMIAFLFTENAPRASGPLEAEVPRTGEVEEHFFEQRIATVDLGTSAVRVVSPADIYVYEYDWAPDSARFVATAAHGSGDNNWWLAQLYVLTPRSGEMKSIFQPKLQIAVPRWSPDGKNIAFISGLMSDEVSTGGDIFVISPAGESLRNLTPEIHGSPSWFAWTSAGELLFVQISGDQNVATTLSLDGTRHELWSSEDFFTASMWTGSLAGSRDGKITAAVRSSFGEAPEVWAGPTGAWKQVTHVNDGVESGWGKFTSLRWKSDNFSVQGWLVFPQNYDANRKYPMVVAVHGGPASAMTAAWPKHFFNPLLLSGQGYFVFFPNARGSFGQGEAFTAANVKDFGYGDLQDIIRGVDYVTEKFLIDKQRLGITGWSYGGFMAMWAVTHTNIFHAAVAGAGLSNWQSYYGENEIDQWMVPYFGASVYDDPAAYGRSSPINFVKNVKTPTLMLVGELDGEVPSPQSFEFWHALKALGVDTKLIVYHGEGHQFRGVENRRDANLRTAEWFNKYLKTDQAAQ